MDPTRSVKKRTLRMVDYGKLQQWEMAVRLMQELRDELLQPNLFTYSALATACGRSGLWQQSLHLLRELCAEQLQPDVHVYGALIAACLQEWQVSMQLLDEMQESLLQPSIVTYNVAMNSLSKGQQWEAAIQIFDSMWSMKLRPDRLSYTTCINALGLASRWATALNFFEAMQRRMKVDLAGTTAAIHACGHGMQWQQSLKLLDDLRVFDLFPSVATYGAAISACERGREWIQAVAMLVQMQTEGLRPNSIAIASALVACQKTMQWRHATSLMAHFGDGQPETHRAKTRLVNDTAAMQACIEAKMGGRALEIFEELRQATEPDAHACFTAVKACGACAHWAMALAITEDMLRRRVPVKAAQLHITADACNMHGKTLAFASLLKGASRRFCSLRMGRCLGYIRRLRP